MLGEQGATSAARAVQVVGALILVVGVGRTAWVGVRDRVDVGSVGAPSSSPLSDLAIDMVDA